MDNVRDFGTARQQSIYDAASRHGYRYGEVPRKGIRAAAQELNLDHSTVLRALQALEAKVGTHQHDRGDGIINRVHPGFATTKITTGTNKDGEVVMHWHQQKPELLALESFAEDLLDAFKSELSSLYTPIPAPTATESELLVSYNIGDHHLGMFADALQTGQEDHDLERGVQLLLNATDHLVSRAPDAAVGVLCNLGDFLHSDDSSARTKSSGHALDVDGCFGRITYRAGLLLKALVERMLAKHDEVWVLNVRGNHDPDSSILLNQVVAAYFHTEPRVKVFDNFNKFLWFEWGKNLVICHHGDRLKRQQFYEAVTRNLSDAWGRCSHRFGWTGHIHHKQQEEIGGMLFESWNVLPPNDAWHAGSGYGASRSMSCVALHKDGGVDVRYEVPVQRLHQE